jgi:predicted phosphodiesterase
MIAIISDIHGNLEALQAVLADAERFKAEAIYCLGDIVAYGPNPRECVDLAMEWKVCLLGNFDFATLTEPRYFSPVAERSVLWSARQLKAPIPSQEASDRRWGFLASLPRHHWDGSILFVHGSPVNALNGYVFPEDIYNPRKLEEIFAHIVGHCFNGHTHIPGVFTAGWKFFTPADLDDVYRLTASKTLCNVGSVGQPRDGDWRACYVLFDGEVIRFRRVEYDIDETIRKIRSDDDLDDFSGDRLKNGQ